jgi:hypothetical protein
MAKKGKSDVKIPLVLWREYGSCFYWSKKNRSTVRKVWPLIQMEIYWTGPFGRRCCSGVVRKEGRRRGMSLGRQVVKRFDVCDDEGR